MAGPHSIRSVARSPRAHPSGEVLAWFRGEVSRTVRWAADPGRPVVTGSRGQRLTPRGSSSVWQETVRGQCLPWSGQEHAIAEETYRVLFEVAARRAAALSAAHTELARSDDELEAFTQAALHDLKEPLRGIADYATLIEEDSAALNDVTVRRLDTIRGLATHMDELLNSLVEYSRLSRADLRITPVPLDDVLDDIEEILGARLAEAGVRLRPSHAAGHRFQRPHPVAGSAGQSGQQRCQLRRGGLAALGGGRLRGRCAARC